MFKRLCALAAAAALMGSAIGSGLPDAPAHASGPLNPPIGLNTGISRVVIHNLYMDNDWDAHNPGVSRASVDDFTRKLLISGYFSKAAQYGVYEAYFTGSDQAVAACPAPGPNFDYNALSSWILCEKHNLPAYGANGTYVNVWQVYVPTASSLNVSFTWPWGHTWPIVQNCATLGHPWAGFHAVTLPSVVPPDGPQVFGAVFLGCFGGSLDGTTFIGSHELIEAATDPTGLAWGNGGEEVGDLCESGTPSFGRFDNNRYAFAAYWSNADGGCVTPGDGATFATVPKVLGTTFAQAATALRAAGFLVSSSYVSDPTCESVGLVVGEQPSAGALTLAGTYVTLKIARAPSNGCL
jgi:hypothetical protein